jgi:hypothetical protein
MKEIIVDVETGVESVRDFTAEEVKQIAETSAIENAVNADALTKLEAKSALFSKLGITKEEAKLLLG